MHRLESAQCPNCGAEMTLTSGSEWATCAYCGKSSFVSHDHPAPPRMQPPPSVPSRPAAAVPILAIVAIGLMVASGAIAAIVLLVHGRASQRTSPAAAPPAATAPDAGALMTHYGVPNGRPPLIVDVNADGTDDVVTGYSRWEEGTHDHYGAFDGRDGTLLWSTPALAFPVHQGEGAVCQGRLLVADQRGQLSVHGLRDGAVALSTTFGDRVERLCTDPRPDVVRVMTADRSAADLDLRTGAKTPSKYATSCTRCPSDARPPSHWDPRLSRDSDLPASTENLSCSSSHVISSEGVFDVANPCPSRVRLAPADAARFDVATIVKVSRGDWLLVGHRQPGTEVPMLGLARSNRLVWSLEVPTQSPLAVTPGKPRHLVVLPDRVVVAYEYADQDRWHLTAVSIADGRRLWDVAVPEAVTDVDLLLPTTSDLLLGGSSHLARFALADGRLRFVLGTSGRPQPRR